MSKIGLNSNIYQVTGKYLDKLNRFIIDAKIHPQKLDKQKRKGVVDFFLKINDADNIEPQIQLLSTIIEKDLWQKKKQGMGTFISEILFELDENVIPTEQMIDKLEIIVNALDIEHTGALAKIKGE
jgi:hypothetical protein